MVLLSDEWKACLPPLGSATRGTPMGKWVAQVRLIDAESQISWYLIEFDGRERFFGLMAGKHAVAGEFSLSELENLRGRGQKQSVRLDTSFRPLSLLELAQENRAVADLLPPSKDLVDLTT